MTVARSHWMQAEASGSAACKVPYLCPVSCCRIVQVASGVYPRVRASCLASSLFSSVLSPTSVMLMPCSLAASGALGPGTCMRIRHCKAQPGGGTECSHTGTGSQGCSSTRQWPNLGQAALLLLPCGLEWQGGFPAPCTIPLACCHHQRGPLPQAATCRGSAAWPLGACMQPARKAVHATAPSQSCLCLLSGCQGWK